MRRLAQVIGVLLVLAGGLWTLQGLGLVQWPADSFMLADRQWAINGAITVLVGAAILWWGSRRPR